MTQKKNYRAAQRHQQHSTTSQRGIGGSGTVAAKLQSSSTLFHPSARAPVTADMLFPQPMEIAFSLEAGSFSSDMFEVPAAPTAPLPNAYVVCFEDVLVPVKWMAQHLDLRVSTKAIADAKERVVRNPYLHESFARIEQAAIQLLTAVSARGPVCILSEQSARFVEALCQALFPRLAFCLASPQVFTNVQVMGAPKKFETAMEKTAWRIQLLQSLVRDRLYAGSPHLLLDPLAGRFGLIVASPHHVDAVACGRATEVAPYLVPKILRIANTRNVTALEQFGVHLQTLGHWLSEATPCTTSFSVEL